MALKVNGITVVDNTRNVTNANTVTANTLVLSNNLAVTHGGTGASSAEGARSNIEAQANLSSASISSVTPANNDVVLIKDSSDANNLKTASISDIISLVPNIVDYSAIADGAISAGDIIELTSAGKWKSIVSSGTPTFSGSSTTQVTLEGLTLSTLDTNDDIDLIDYAYNPDTGRFALVYTFWDNSLSTQYLRVKHAVLTPSGITEVGTAAGDTLETSTSNRSAEAWMCRIRYNPSEDQFYVCYAGTTANDLKARILVENGENDFTLGTELSVLTGDLSTAGFNIYLYYDTRQSVMVLVYGRTTSRFISVCTLRNVSSTTITQGTQNNIAARDVSYQTWHCAYDPNNQIYCVIFNGGTYNYMRSFYASSTTAITLGTQVLFSTTGGGHSDYNWIGYDEVANKFVAFSAYNSSNLSRCSTSTTTDVNSWQTEHASSWTLTSTGMNTGYFNNTITNTLTMYHSSTLYPVEDAGTNQYEMGSSEGTLSASANKAGFADKWFETLYDCLFLLDAGTYKIATWLKPTTNASLAIGVAQSAAANNSSCSGILFGVDTNQSGMTPATWQYVHTDGNLVEYDTTYPKIGYALTATDLLVIKENV